MQIILCGYRGYMGREMIAVAEKRGIAIAAGIDPMADGSEKHPCFKTFDECNVQADLVVDFSHHTSAPALAEFAVKHHLPMIVATTGHTPQEQQVIRDAAAAVPVFYAGNYSLGVAVLTQLARRAASFFPDADIEIVEAHHNRKVDAPSGTAIGLANAISEELGGVPIVCGRNGYSKREPHEIGISSVRMGNVVGIHEIYITTGTQTITLKHEAHSRTLFAEGALDAAAWMEGRPAGLYDMTDLTAE